MSMFNVENDDEHKQISDVCETPTSSNDAATFLTALPTGDNVVTLRCTSWQLGDGVGTLRFVLYLQLLLVYQFRIQRLCIILSCARCNVKCEFNSTPNRIQIVQACKQCRLRCVD
jgi:hypothetical protein